MTRADALEQFARVMLPIAERSTDVTFRECISHTTTHTIEVTDSELKAMREAARAVREATV